MAGPANVSITRANIEVEIGVRTTQSAAVTIHHFCIENSTEHVRQINRPGLSILHVHHYTCRSPPKCFRFDAAGYMYQTMIKPHITYNCHGLAYRYNHIFKHDAMISVTDRQDWRSVTPHALSQSHQREQFTCSQWTELVAVKTRSSGVASAREGSV